MPSRIAAYEIIKSIALEGLNYATNEYDINRYQRLLDIVSKEYADLTDHDVALLKERYLQDIDVQTPHAGVLAVTADTRGHLLILKRSDNGLWCHPAGWIDFGENPFEAAIRELKEETGLISKPQAIIGLLSIGAEEYPMILHQVALRLYMEPVPVDSAIQLSHEHTDYQWIDPYSDNLETIDWYGTSDEVIKDVIKYRESGQFVQPDFS